MIETIENSHLKVSVKASGAEMVSLKPADKDIELLWHGDPKYWARRAPVLFPVVGKLHNNTYKAEGKTYVLPQHGFARDMIFDLISTTPTSLSYRLQADEVTLKNYPYRFELHVIYELKGASIEVTYKVHNTDNRTIWFSIGGHPAYKVPALDGESFEDYVLEFEEEETVDRQLLKDGLFTGKAEAFLEQQREVPLSHELFQKDAIVLKKLKSSFVTLKSKISPYQLKFSFKNFPYLGIWSAPNNAPFVCIEPWYGLADTVGFEGELKEKEGIQKLEQGESFTCTYTVNLKI